MKTIFKGIWNNWIHDWNTNKTLFFLEAIGTLACIIAALVLAINSKHPDMLLAYSFYLLGSGTLAIASYMRNNGWWVLLNLTFASIDILGIKNLLS